MGRPLLRDPIVTTTERMYAEQMLLQFRRLLGRAPLLALWKTLCVDDLLLRLFVHDIQLSYMEACNVEGFGLKG